MDELVEKLLTSNQAPLSWKSTSQTLPAYFLRIHPQSRNDAEQVRDARNFMDSVLKKLAAELHIDTERDVKADADNQSEKKQQFVGDSHSQDRFKLTLLYFRDLIRIADLQSYDEMIHKYRTFLRNREYLHTLAAEQNALHFEQKIKEINQRERELDNRVVMLLEDMETFKLAARCLVYGDKAFHWNQGEQRLLLFREIDQARKEIYAITAIPESRRKGVSRLSREVQPERWQITSPADKASLVEAIDNFIYRASDVNNPTRKFRNEQNEYPRLFETLKSVMAQDVQSRQEKGKLYAKIPGWLQKQSQRLQQAQEQIAQLRTYQYWLECVAEPRLLGYENETQPGKFPGSPDQQREADLWTLLYLVIREEAGRLEKQIEEQDGVELYPVPLEEMRPEPETEVEAIESKQLGEEPTSDDIKCPHCGKTHPVETKFCPEKGEPIPQPAENFLCPHCNKQHPVGTKFCPQFGTPIQQPDEDPLCPHCGKAHPVETKFCPNTGGPL